MSAKKIGFIFLGVILSVPHLYGQAVTLVWEPVAAGVWKATIGQVQPISLLDAAGAKPSMQALDKLGGRSFPASLQDSYAEKQQDHLYLRFPLQEDEQIYGLGLHFKTIGCRGQVLNLHTDHYAGTDNGRTHAPTPFYLTNKGYGIFINSAQYLTVYAGTGVRRDSHHPPFPYDRNTDSNWTAQPLSDAVEFTSWFKVLL